MLTSLAVWIVLGLIAGFIASKMFRREEGLVLDIVIGILGAVIGGWIFRSLGSTGATGLNVWSLLVAVVGAIVLLGVWGAVRGSVIRT